jgi:hypothetical protein
MWVAYRQCGTRLCFFFSFATAVDEKFLPRPGNIERRPR